jgi:hypothetical protein
MPPQTYELNGVRIFQCSVDAPELRSDRDAIDLISEAGEHRATFIVIPIERLGDDFFELRTRIAGEIVQKFVTYGRRIAIIGDIDRRMAESSSLRAFVHEANRGNQVWFVASLAELDKRLFREGSGEGAVGSNRE